MNVQRIIDQLKIDEGFIAKAKWDVKQFSYGYGCRAPNGNATISEPAAAELLAQHVQDAIFDFKDVFGHHRTKMNDVRQEAFVNMVFNMGPGSTRNPKGGGMRSFVNTLALIFDHPVPDWEAVAEALRHSKWYRQVRKSGDPDGPGPELGRGERICKEIETGVKQ